eukprot:UN16413
MLVDAGSGRTGFLLFIYSQILASSWVHQFLKYLDEKVEWFDVEEFLTQVCSVLYDILAYTIKYQELGGLIGEIMTEQVNLYR